MPTTGKKMKNSSENLLSKTYKNENMTRASGRNGNRKTGVAIRTISTADEMTNHDQRKPRNRSYKSTSTNDNTYKIVNFFCDKNLGK